VSTPNCWYCGEPGCNCGSRWFMQMRDALVEISEYAVDEHADTPRDVLANIRTMAALAVERLKPAHEVGGFSSIHDNGLKEMP
jgi:hypothetical protein